MTFYEKAALAISGVMLVLAIILHLKYGRDK